ncbi:MAG: hypothetical protein F6J93_16680 [Oscillatoria sp. SIO1A7]|nr:hypothetical protein [Oscillatoria sp. SIO1A7]
MLIIDAGGAKDRASIPLATKRGNFIPNERGLYRPPEALEEAAKIWQDKYPNIRVRSLTSEYNCVGMVFGCRRTAIDIEHIGLILKEDSYRRLYSEGEVLPGDVVLYGNGDRYTHIGTILSKEPDVKNASFKITVLSQWGFDGEYIHLLDEVPDNYGNVKEFWTERS